MDSIAGESMKIPVAASAIRAQGHWLPPGGAWPISKPDRLSLTVAMNSGKVVQGWRQGGTGGLLACRHRVGSQGE